MKREKSCGAIVFIGEVKPKFLVVQHKKNVGNHWDFPKGHVEKAETEKATAQREVFEETGITYEHIKGFRQKISYKMHNGIWKDVIFFLGKSKQRKIILSK